MVLAVVVALPAFVALTAPSPRCFDERYWNTRPHYFKPAVHLLCRTILYLLTNGFGWARFVALLVEVVGAETMDASTFYSALNAAGAIPLLFMIWLDGFGYNKLGARGLLWTDAASNLLVFAILLTLFVIRGMSLRSSPRPRATQANASRL